MKSSTNDINVYCAHDEIVDILRVNPNPRNPNIHSEFQIDLLARMIKYQGWRAPITVSNLSGYVVRGHCRLLAAQKLGLSVVPVDYQDYENAADEYADLIADNKIQELSRLNIKTTKEIIDELDGKIDVSLTGFMPIDLDKLISDIRKHDNQYKPGESREASGIKVEMLEDEIESLSITDEEKAYFDDKTTIAIALSGGIDSSFCAFWARTNFPDKRIIGIFSDPGVELPGMAFHVYRLCESIGIEFQLVKPDRDMVIEICKKQAFPATIMPWCQVDFIYNPINNWILANLPPEETIIITGSKADQSTRLQTKKSKTSSSHEKRMEKYQYFSPAYNIKRETTIEILKKHKVHLWWGYDMGFIRTACWMCPGMSGTQALMISEHFPGHAAYIKEIEAYIKKPLDPLTGKTFQDKVESGKRKRERLQKGILNEVDEELDKK